MEIIPDHVVSRAHVELEQWKQLMYYYQELACLTNLGDRVMEVITWKVSYEFIKFQVADAHFG
jgi:hypothetical protein